MNPSMSPADGAPYVILVGMAFDDTDAPALREALRIAALQPRSELHVVHAVVEESATTATAGLVSVDGRLQEAPLEMQRRIEALQSDVPRRITGHMRVGGPVGAILRTAADIEADVIVVGTHQRKGLKKLMLGSVASNVLQEAHCPVLIAIPKDHSSTPRSEQVEPACPACLEARASTNDPNAWCERHSHRYMKPHVYEPSEAPRNSVMTGI